MALLAASIEILIAGGSPHTVGLVSPPPYNASHTERNRLAECKCLPRAVVAGFSQSGLQHLVITKAVRATP